VIEENGRRKHAVPTLLSGLIMTMIINTFFYSGGGFALSEAAKKNYSDLNGKIGEVLRHLHDLPNYIVIFLIIIFTMFITNFASNVAVCNVIAPIVMQMVSIRVMVFLRVLNLNFVHNSAWLFIHKPHRLL
jgi:hypothetical protein